MNSSILAVCTLIGVSIACTSAIAGETVTTNQSDAINIRAIVQINRSDDTNHVVNQSGLYNSVGAVSFGSGGYTSVYQSGQANRALIGQYGQNQNAIVNQIQNGEGIFSQFGTMSR